MKKAAMALMVLVLCGMPLAAGATTDWAVDGRGITLNGNAFTVQGVNYSPTPIGGTPAYIPFGDYFIDAWASISQRDMPLMRAANVNSVRLYGMWPYVKDKDFNNGAVASHADFLNAALGTGGESPIYVFDAYSISADIFHYKVVDSTPAAGTWYVELNTGPGGALQIWVADSDYNDGAGKTYRDTVVSEYKEMVTALKDNDAIMGFIVSNELNSLQNINYPVFWSWINDLAGDIKTIAPNKLTMMTLVDDSMSSVPKAEAATNHMPNLDMWGINSYRGTQTTGFDILFSSYEQASSKPMMVSEYGCPASIHLPDGSATLQMKNAQAQSDYIKVHWNDIAANSDIAVGGYIFEWTDEWWKNGSITTHDASSVVNNAFPGGYDDEEWFGLNGVSVTGGRPVADPWNPGQPNAPDTPSARAAVSMLTGLWQ